MKTRILFGPLRPQSRAYYTVRSGRYLILGGSELIHLESGVFIGNLTIQTPIIAHAFSWRLPWPFYRRTELTEQNYREGLRTASVPPDTVPE